MGTFGRRCASCFLLALGICQLAAGQVFFPYAPPPSPPEMMEEPYYPTQGWDGCFLGRPAANFGQFTFDILIFDRGNYRNQPLLSDAITGATLLSSADLHAPAKAGFRFIYTTPLYGACDVQFSYAGVHQFGESGEVSSPANGVSTTFFGRSLGFVYDDDGDAATPDVGITTVTADFASNYDSFEVNVRSHEWQKFAPLVGFRATQLEDRYLTLHPQSGGSGVSGRSDNELYGLQFGVESMLVRSARHRLEASLKAGVFFNDIDLTGSYTDATGTAVTLSKSVNSASFLGELGATWVYEIDPHWLFRLGYQAVFLDQVAQLVDQFDQIAMPSGEGEVDFSSLVLQGGFVGMEFIW